MATTTLQTPSPTLARPTTPAATPFFHYVAVLLQAAILLFLAERFRLENDLFLIVLKVGIAGFAVHHLLPHRLRLGFFTLLSLGTIVYCLGLEQNRWNPLLGAERGLWVFGFGAVLIGICHLPVSYLMRVAALALAACGLAAVRSGVLKLPVFESVWPAFAAMFMFRIIIYLYDLDTDKRKPTLLQSVSYFFTFPNLWLYVSPVLDFKSFHRSYYNKDAVAIYQKGIVWILRGMFHLLLWRIVYYQVYVDPARVTNGVELAQFLIGNMALYLRLSGQFHIMTGLLHLFGFNLAETHRLYALAPSFNEYWRRVNIYWKDFMVKIFFYPLYARLKGLGIVTSIALATLIVFGLTWILHPYQFFWIRGTFPIKATDTLFWGILGVLVAIGSIRELRAGPKGRKTISKSNSNWGYSLRQALFASLILSVLTLLWSIWSCDSLGQWIDLWRNASLQTGALWLLSMLVVFLFSLWFEGPIGARINALWNSTILQHPHTVWRQAVASCLIPSALMLASTSGHVTSRILSTEGQAIAASVYETRPNKSDEEFMVRGYYEDLADTSRFQTLLNDGFRNQPADWMQLEQTPAIRPVNDLRSDELVPSLDTVVNGRHIITNQWGMRDNPVDPANPRRAIRIAVLGASHEMGYGVDQGESFSDVLEHRLNEGLPPGARPVEILNFAVNHYSPVAQVEVLNRKVLRFHPDAVLFFAHREDVGVVMRLFGQALRQGVQPSYPALAEIAEKAGVGHKTPRSIAERKLIPHWPAMIEWAYQEIARTLRAEGILPIWVLQQGVFPHPGADEGARMVSFAKAAGFEIWSMEDVFRSADPNSLIVAPWDTHPNAAGHRMIADRLQTLVASSRLLERAAARSTSKRPAP